jgi:hypothetical protein
LKSLKDIDKQVMLYQIQSMRNIYQNDSSKDAKLTILENAISVVGRNKDCLGKVKSMSSLEKNRIALNMISVLRDREREYRSEKEEAVKRNIAL